MSGHFFQEGITFQADIPKCCHICAKEVENLTTEDLALHIKSPPHHKSRSLFQKHFVINQNNLQCKTCNSDLTWLEVKKHGKSHEILPWNKPNLTLYLNNVSILRPQEYYCNLCDVKLSSWFTILTHIYEENHLKLRSSNPHFARVFSKVYNDTNYLYYRLSSNCITFIDIYRYNCIVCSVELENLKDVFLHIECNEHIQSQKKFRCHVSSSKGDFSECRFKVPECYKWMTTPYDLKFSKDSIYCTHCKISMQNEGAVRSHLKSHLTRSAEAELMFSRHAATLENVSPEEIETLKRSCLSMCPGAVDSRNQEVSTLRVVPEDLRWMLKAHKITIFKDTLYCKHCNVRMKNDGAVLGHLRSHMKLVLAKLLPGSPDMTPLNEFRKKNAKVDGGRSCIQPLVPDLLYLLQEKDHVFEMDQEKLEDLKLCSLLTTCSNGNNYCWLCSINISNDVQDIYEHWRSHIWIRKELQNKPCFLEGEANVSVLDLVSEYVSKNLFCNLCEESLVTLDEAGFDEHILKAEHAEKKEKQRNESEKLYEHILFHHTSNWYNIEKYCCLDCSFKFLNTQHSFIRHIEEQHNKRNKDRAGKVIFDSCVPCGILWMGRDNFYLEHKGSKDHQGRVQEYKRVFGLLKEAEKLCSSMDQSINESLAQADNISRIDAAKDEDLMRRLEAAVNLRFPRAKAHTSGSRVAGLASLESDINVFLDSGHAYFEGLNSKDEYDVMRNAVQCLQAKENGKEKWEVIQVLPTNRTPIIKAKDLQTGLKCDISFRNGIAVENTKLIMKYCEAYPPCRKMILFLKKWMSICELSGSRKIENCATSWLVIFYLQNMGILPTVAQLIAEKNQSQIISGWETGVLDKITAEQTELSLKDLLTGFFIYYLEFNFKYNVVCPLTGETLSKLTFKNLEQLPPSMEPYLWHLQTADDPEIFLIKRALCVQDPFDLSHNLTRLVDKSLVHYFKLMCMKSAELLS